MNRYEQAITEVRSVLAEWREDDEPVWPVGTDWNMIIAKQIVERLIAKGVIQSTDPDDLVRPV